VPFTPVYDIMGNFSGQFEGPTSEMGNGENPVAQMERTKNDIHRQWRAIGNAYMDIDFAKNFKFHTSYGINVLNQYDRSFTFNNYDEKEGFANPNALSESRGNSFYWIWTNTLNYNKDFGENSLNILIGSEAIETTNQSLSGSRQNFFTDAEDFLILDNGTQNITNSSSISSQSLFSLFGKIDYSFSDKYLLGVTLRRDGSSRFGIADKYGVFPSFSVGWRLSRERFLSNLEWLTNLLVRGSYGILGSQNNVNSTNAFTTFSSNVNNSYYDISGTNTSSAPGIYQSHIGNEKTSWEKDKVLNVGIDGVFFNGKLSFTGEYYDKRINGLLFSQPLPATAGGAGSPVINIGNIRNKGFDFSVGYQDNILKDFGYRAALNLTSYKNDVVSVPDPGYFDTYDSRFGTLIRNQEGSAVSSFFGYKVIGLFQSQDDVDHSPTQSGAAPGRFKYEDVNGDGSITPDDRVVLGSPNPDFSYGLNVGVNFRNFDLSAIFYGVQGADIFRYTKWFTYFMSSYRDGKSKEMLNAWTPDNTNTDIPINETTSNFSTSSVANSFYVENGSFLKLRSLSVGYNFTKEILNKSKIKSLRVYLQGTNLFTATKYKGLDPEILSSGSNASFGVDLGTYPTNERSFVFGINLSF
jgi:TonB-linked SusC/RagA family outer membrane protein